MEAGQRRQRDGANRPAAKCVNQWSSWFICKVAMEGERDWCMGMNQEVYYTFILKVTCMSGESSWKLISYYYKIICHRTVHVSTMKAKVVVSFFFFLLSGLFSLGKKKKQQKRSLDVLSWRQRLWKSFQGACVPKHAVLSQPEVITVFIRWFYYKYDLGLNHKQILYVCFWTFWWLQSAKFQIGILIVWWLNYSLANLKGGLRAHVSFLEISSHNWRCKALNSGSHKVENQRQTGVLFSPW